MATNHSCLRALLFIVFALFATATPANDGDEPTLTLGVFPRQNPIQTARMFNGLAEHLGRELKMKVVLDTPKDFASFWEKVSQRKYDLVHLNQYHYVKAHKESHYDVILKNIEFNESTIAGAILVRADTRINKVADLKGKKIVFGGGPDAMQAYIVARYLLQQGGLNKGDYEESFAVNPPNAIMSTFYKQSDAAGAGDKVLHLAVVKKQIDINEMKYLVTGTQLTHLPWAVKRELPAATRERIQTIMHGLASNEAGKAILKQLALDGFAIANDKEFDEHRHIIKSVLNEAY
jgi:phosphonate transport system substrate-binding protein